MTKLLAQDLNWANVSSTYQPLTQIELSNYIAAFIQLGLGIIAIACLLFLLIGGYRWITSKGEKEAMAKSQKTISGALIGLIIALAIFLILGLLSIFTRVNLFKICIPGVGQSCDIQYAYPFDDSGSDGGGEIIPGDPPTGTLGGYYCTNCGSSGGCGIVGTVYIGPVLPGRPNPCFMCDLDGWHDLGSDCTGLGNVACGTCPPAP